MKKCELCGREFGQSPSTMTSMGPKGFETIYQDDVYICISIGKDHAQHQEALDKWGRAYFMCCFICILEKLGFKEK